MVSMGECLVLSIPVIVEKLLSLGSRMSPDRMRTTSYSHRIASRPTYSSSFSPVDLDSTYFLSGRVCNTGYVLCCVTQYAFTMRAKWLRWMVRVAMMMFFFVVLRILPAIPIYCCFHFIVVMWFLVAHMPGYRGSSVAAADTPVRTHYTFLRKSDFLTFPISFRHHIECGFNPLSFSLAGFRSFLAEADWDSRTHVRKIDFSNNILTLWQCGASGLGVGE